MERPFGVTILSILEAIGGLIYLGYGILIFWIATIAGAIAEMMPGGIPVTGIESLVVGIATIIGVILIVLALVAFLLAYGLWVGRGWAWTISLIFAIIGLIFSILSLPGGIIGLIINILILYYLTRPHVKVFFGKGPPPEAPPPPPP